MPLVWGEFLFVGCETARGRSRRTGTVTRPVRTGTGLLNAFVSVIAVMNSFGRPQGLLLIPETASYRGVPATDEYDDLLDQKRYW